MNAITENVTLFTPNTLLDEMIAKLGLKNDAALARYLEIGPPMISKIRRGKTPVSDALLIVFHEATGCSIKDLRFLMGDTRPHTGKSAVALDATGQ